mgnify:CR=1 FL=1
MTLLWDLMVFYLKHFFSSFHWAQAPSVTRRTTAAYRLKQGIVKQIWLASSCVMLVNPFMPFILSLVFLTTFLSFSILDETA